MTRPTFILGLLFFVANIAIDLVMVFSGLPTLGGMLAFLTVLVFVTGIIWFIHLDDGKMRLLRVWLVFPLALVGVAFYKVLALTSSLGKPTAALIAENLSEMGNLLMARYQMGLWLAAVILFSGFMIASALMEKTND